MINAQSLTRCAVAPATAITWAPALDAACQANGITTPQRLSGFLACILHETGGLTTFSENLNYTPAALLSLFGNRITSQQANAYGRTPAHAADQVAIANTIYGGPWGVKNLGNTAPGDGWLFRGAGPMQTTGRANFTRFGKAIGYTGPVETLPAYVRTVEGGSSAAAIFWRQAGCNELCDAGRYRDARVKVNGGLIGYDDFKARLDRILPILTGVQHAKNIQVASAKPQPPAPVSESDALNDASLARAKSL